MLPFDSDVSPIVNGRKSIQHSSSPIPWNYRVVKARESISFHACMSIIFLAAEAYQMFDKKSDGIM
jgi:hypothetical protein